MDLILALRWSLSPVPTSTTSAPGSWAAVAIGCVGEAAGSLRVDEEVERLFFGGQPGGQCAAFDLCANGLAQVVEAAEENAHGKHDQGANAAFLGGLEDLGAGGLVQHVEGDHKGGETIVL